MVTQIIDGDTIEVRYGDGTTKRIRFIGVDTPEMNFFSDDPPEPFAQEAKEYVESLIPVDSHVYLVYDRQLLDRYDRILAYVYIHPMPALNNMLNHMLIKEGLGEVMMIYPNNLYESEFRNAEYEAKLRNRNLWQNLININEPIFPSPTVEEELFHPVKNPSKGRDRLHEKYVSFSGSDAIASIIIPYSNPIILGNLRAISYSTLRPLAPVRGLGRIVPVGYGKSPRTVAGTLIFFASWNEHWVNALARTSDIDLPPDMHPDELPPLDVVINIGTEYGAVGSYGIYGLRFIDGSQVTSDQDIITENVATFEAMDVRYLSPHSSKITPAYKRTNLTFKTGGVGS